MGRRKVLGNGQQEGKHDRESSYVISERPSLLTFITPSNLPLLTEEPPPRCLVSVLSPARTRWDLFILTMVVWNCFYVPFSVAFSPKKELMVLTVIDVFIDFAYLFDIVVYARTTYLELGTGQEVTDTRKILFRYARSGRLVIDILSAFPFDVIALVTANYEELQLFTLSKVFRLLRFGKAMMFFQVKVNVKLTLKLIHLLFLFATYLHLVACLWFLLASVSATYTPPALYLMEDPELYSSSIWRQYAYSLYMSVYMLTGAELGPRTEWERIFMGVTLLLGQLFQAFMFGEIAVVLFDLSKQKDKITEIQAASATTMANMDLDSSLRSRVSSFLISMQGSFMRQTEYEDFFSVLSPSLKKEVHSVLFEPVLLRNPALREHSEISATILSRLSTLYCQPEQHIVTQGQPADCFYLVAHGKCEVEVFDAQGSVHFVKYLLKGAHFGEVALLYSTTRTATVKSRDYVTVAVLDRTGFELVCRLYPQAASIMKTSALRYIDVWKQFQLATLRRCPYFHNLSDKTLSRILYLLPIRVFQENSDLYKEGEKCTFASFIIEGQVEIQSEIRENHLVSAPSAQLLSQTQHLLNMKINLVRSAYLRHQKAAGKLFKVTIENLGPGSALCTTSLALGETVNCIAKASRLTIAMTLSSDLLNSIRASHGKIQAEVTTFLDRVTGEIGPIRLRREHFLALDYAKGPSETVSETLCNGKLKVKRIIMSKLLERRKIRSIGFDDVSTMSNKLKAISAVADITDLTLLEKIRIGVAPTSEHLLDAYNLLGLPEVAKPLLTQFAIHTVKVVKLLEATKRKMTAVQKVAKSVKKTRKKVRMHLDDIKRFANLCVQIQFSSRIQTDWRVQYQ